MRRNNNINPHRFEQHLSPIGRKVLNDLVQQWNADREGNKSMPISGQSHKHRAAQNSNSDVPYSRETYELQKNANDEAFCDLVHAGNSLPRMPLSYPPSNFARPAVLRSAELVTTVGGKAKDPHVFREDLLKSALKPVETLNIEQDLYDTDISYEEESRLTNKTIRHDTNTDTTVSREVDWENMFDTELFSEMDTPILENIQNEVSKENVFETNFACKNTTDLKTNSNQLESDWHASGTGKEYIDYSENMIDTGVLAQMKTPTASILENIQERISKGNHFEINFPGQSNTDMKSNSKGVKRNVSKQLKDANSSKVTKSKKQSKITDAAPRKVKKPVIEYSKQPVKNSFRKEKYTKTVKNWLNNVQSDNSVEEFNESNSTVEAIPNENSKNSKPEIIIEKTAKEKLTKKIIQAQLANKDGIMKFGKPKMIKNDTTSKSAGVTEREMKEVEKENPAKDKKSKPKFVAPIKSQIPVKDLVFQVNSVDNTNIEEDRKILFNVENCEVIVVILYSNGFCQLNNHHTDDTCIPEAIMIHFNDRFYYFKDCDKTYSEILARILNTNNIVCYDGKSLLIYLLPTFELQLTDTQNVIDVKIGGSLVDADNPPENFSELQNLLNFVPQYTIATECPLQKAAWYITLLQACARNLRTLLKQDNLWNIFKIEMQLLPIIADMERRGVCVDLEKLKTMETILLTKMKKVEQLCHEAAGKVFQINSTVQVRTILYDELKLDSKCNIKIRETITKGAKSTSETMLRNLMSDHPLPKLILEYRHLHKAHSTFLTGIAQHVKDGIIKPTWVQVAAATGRMASNNPNLQAIPKTPFNMVMFPEANETDNRQLSFRSIYVPRAGYSFLSADFKHVECRVFAYAAADAELLHALRPGVDLFRVLAAKWLGKAEGDVSSTERERTKRIVYASLYGAGARKLMDILEVSYDQALTVIASFNRTFPALKSFGRSVVSQCAAAGGRLASLCGRVRRVAHIGSADFALRSHAERQAVNFVVQGSAADLCKLAMVQTTERLRTARPPLDCHLVLQIHDELVWEVPSEDLDRAAALVQAAMEGCGVCMPLPVAARGGCSWGHMAELRPPPATTTDA